MGKAIVFAFWVLGSVALWPTATGRVSRRTGPAVASPVLFGYELRAGISVRRQPDRGLRACAVATDTVFVVMPSRQWSTR